jgi:DNA-binding MarR family transcriptional regulator
VRACPSVIAGPDEVAKRLGISAGDAASELERLERRGAVARIGAADMPIYVFLRE